MAESDSYMATVDLWAGNYAPQSWAFCEGQLLTIGDFNALYALMGTAYGGNGYTTFALPDMRGRVPLGCGSDPALPSFALGHMGGSEYIALDAAHMPAHTHSATLTSNITGSVALPVKTGFASGGSNPVDKYFGSSGSDNIYYDEVTPNAKMAPVDVDITGSESGGTVTVNNSGSSESFSIIQPYTVLNYIICLDGTFPPRGS